MIFSNDLVTLVTFTQPHRECLRFFYHNECGLWCPGYGHVTLNWVCSVIKLEEISSKDYWSNQNSDLRSTQQSCWKSRNLSMTKKSSQFSENDKNQMRYFGDFQTLWKWMTFFVLFRIWRMKNSSIWNFKKETNPDFRLKFQ